MPPEFFSLQNVSRETCERLEAYVNLLKKWTGAINLIAPSTTEDIWKRHIEDSAQLYPFVQGAKRMADLGAGGGLPSVVLAILGCGSVHAMESDARKCTFLQECRRVLHLEKHMTVHHGRIESVNPLGCDAIVSRACAPLDNLLRYAHRHLASSGRCFFLKGKHIEHEISVASRWQFDYALHQSTTSPDGVILELYNLESKV
jgi:16S rRNA (guanine527-N7)-methyltransferase